MIELLIVSGIVVSAGGFLAYTFYRQTKAKNTGCSNCRNCKQNCKILSKIV
jgi:hypothetical protein